MIGIVRNLRVRTKIATAFFLILGAIVTSTVIGLMSLSRITDQFEVVFRSRFEPTLDMAQIIENWYRARNALVGHLTATTESEFSARERVISEMDASISSLVSEYSSRQLDKAERAILDRYQVAASEYKEYRRAHLEVSRSMQKEKALEMTKGGGMRFEKMVVALRDLMAQQRNEANASLNEATMTAQSSITSLLIVGTVALFLGILLTILLTRSVIIPLNRITKHTAAVEAGDLSVRVQVDSRDEFGILADRLNGMTQALEHSVADAKKRSEYLSHSVKMILAQTRKMAHGDFTVVFDDSANDEIGELCKGLNGSVSSVRSMLLSIQSISDMVADAIARISSSTEQISAASQDSASQTEGLASALLEMNAVIGDNSSNGGVAAEAATRGVELARNGIGVVVKTVRRIGDVSDVISGASGAIDSLIAVTDKIGEINEAITEIATQTRLLSLNAAIEAARAGEHGRGFAIVADEVRKLADRSNLASRQIAELVINVQAQTNHAKDVIDEGNVFVTKLQGYAEQTQTSLDDIIESVEKVGTLITQVASAGAELSATSDEIARNMEVYSRATHETNSGLQEINSSAAVLVHRTGDLVGLMGRFQIGEAQVDQPSGSYGQSSQQRRLPARVA